MKLKQDYIIFVHCFSEIVKVSLNRKHYFTDTTVVKYTPNNKFGSLK